ncbi:PAS domain S-box-containing protein [Halovenus aranensis]|uniref:histidine kinase n=1 Tax=Halovenus aranensis TaxID=890420 RepID=A0A1G8WTK9_9EURY|nr:GAF domain-containing protein [Halovenus aranensis]SDJ80955.1 PAS domain S-box-containing protein [Halovenus aranensis]
MNAQQRLRALYEISLTVESKETVEATATEALTAYLEHLHCAVGAVFHTEDEALSLVSAVPGGPAQSDLLAVARDRLESDAQATDRSSMTASLPVSEIVAGVGEYHLFELPAFGVLVLGTDERELDDATLAALPELNETVARACSSAVTRERRRAQRDRFEAVFEAIPDPVVTVVVEDGVERIARANEAFEERFGYEDDAIRGQRLDALIRPGDGEFDSNELVAALDRGDSFTAEIKRETCSGTGHFLFNAVPLATQLDTEYVGIYVDITARKEREQTLEALSGAVQDLLDEDSRQQVCARAVEAVESVFGYANVGVHLYNRERETLEPAAVTEQLREQFDDEPPRYTTRDTVIWEAYETRDPVRINDVDTFEGRLPDRETPAESAVVLPVGVHGVLIASESEPHGFTDRDVQFLRLLSQLVAVALDRSTNRNRLAGVQRAISKALQAETHEEMAETVLDTIPAVLDLPLVGVWQYQPSKKVLEPLGMTQDAVTLIGDPPPFDEDGESIAWQAFDSGSTTLVSDASQHPDAYNDETPIKGEIIVPIGDFGVMTAGSTYEDSFTQFDAEVLEILAANLEIVAEVIDSRQDVALLEQVIARVLRHNVRNKLTPIRGYASTIAAEVDQPLDAYAEAVIENCDELARTAEHAREMRTVVQRRDQMTTVSLAEAVRTATATVESEFPEGELLLNIEAEPDVTAHLELTTALRHLIRNGFDHNDSERPRVVVTVDDRPAGPTVEIDDDGPGIDAYEVEIIDRHGESALEHGSGAGLWIIDRVIEYSEALLDFETDDGTTATVTFPQ